MDNICKIFINTQPVIVINDEYYNVSIFYDDLKLKKNTAYIKGDYVYIYRGKIKSKKEMSLPGIYKKGIEYIFIEPSDKVKDKYHVNNIIELDPNSIFDLLESKSGTFIDPEDLEIINDSSDIYTPSIKENDDFLKYIVKKAIIEKHINLRQYKGRFGNEYALNNMKSGLNKTTKMTVVNFLRWCEVLGLDFELRVWDNGSDNINPLSNDIVISSKDIL